MKRIIALILLLASPAAAQDNSCNYTPGLTKQAFDECAVELGLKAPLASPALTGNPTAPTASGGDNDTSISTTAFVQAALAGLSTVYAPLVHAHTIADVTGLSAALAVKLDASAVSAFALTVLDDTTAAAMRTTLGLGTAALSATGDFAPADPTLGTQTQGNYVAGLTNGFGIAVTGASGEGWSPAVAVNLTGTLTDENCVTYEATGPALEVQGCGGASPGGAAGEVQYNNGGAFAGATDVEIEGGQLRLPAISTPTAPASDGLKLFGRDLSGRMMPAFIGPSGLDTSLQPLLGSNSIAYAVARGASAVIDSSGLLVTVTGAATIANASTGYWGRVRKMEMLVTTPATSAVAGYRGTGRLWTVGSDVDGTGGFFFIQRWGVATGLANSTDRAFAGFAPLTVAPSDVNPSTRTEIVGMGWDSSDANIQIFHNDGSGTATKIDTGIVKPSVDRTDILELAMFSPPSTTQSVTWRVINMTTGDQATGVITTDLPSSTSFLNVFGYTSAGGTSSVTGFAFRSIYIETDQ